MDFSNKNLAYQNNVEAKINVIFIFYIASKIFLYYVNVKNRKPVLCHHRMASLLAAATTREVCVLVSTPTWPEVALAIGGSPFGLLKPLEGYDK